MMELNRLSGNANFVVVVVVDSAVVVVDDDEVAVVQADVAAAVVVNDVTVGVAVGHLSLMKFEHICQQQQQCFESNRV